MYGLIVLSVAIATASAATFFESPHNERASAFYKVPIQRDFSSPVYSQGPSRRPQPSYQSGPSNYQQPSYQSGPSHFQQQSHHSGPSHYQSQGGYGQGATSFQTVQLGGQSYGPRY